MAVVWKTKMRWDTGYSADSVEWCPVEPYRNVLVCGTYQLDKNNENLPSDEQATKQNRLGKIYLFHIDDKTQELNPLQTVDTSGILDQKWCYHSIDGHPTLAVVTSVGTLQLYQLTNQDNELELKLWLSHVIGENILALSVDWSTNKTLAGDCCLVVSDSAGKVNVLKLIDGGLELVGVWKSHGFEAWIGAFNYWNPNIFYSGGDDCIFKSYDMRVSKVPVSSNKSHGAGVTAIRNDIETENRLLTGSYDEKVRIWDTRVLTRCIHEENVNGGVWRLKWHPYKLGIVLAACMYGGFRILRVGEESLEILSEYMDHESIAYGADWKFDNESSVIATCSFYDAKMHLSEAKFLKKSK